MERTHSSQWKKQRYTMVVEYKTHCRLCDDPMTISVAKGDDEACSKMGIDPNKWMGTLICVKCSYYRNTGKRPPLSSNVRDFLLGDEG